MIILVDGRRLNSLVVCTKQLAPYCVKHKTPPYLLTECETPQNMVTKNIDKTSPSLTGVTVNGAYYMRERDTFVVHVFESVARQRICATHIFRNFESLTHVYPGLFASTRHLRSFVNQRPSKRRKRGDIRDRMSIQAVHMQVPVFVPRGRHKRKRQLSEEECDAHWSDLFDDDCETKKNMILKY